MEGSQWMDDKCGNSVLVGKIYPPSYAFISCDLKKKTLFIQNGAASKRMEMVKARVFNMTIMHDFTFVQ